MQDFKTVPDGMVAFNGQCAHGSMGAIGALLAAETDDGIEDEIDSSIFAIASWIGWEWAGWESVGTSVGA